MEKRKYSKTELEEKVIEQEDAILRLRADFENYKKHLDKEKTTHITFANEELIKELLPVLDSLECAAKATKDEEAKKGLDCIHKQLLKVLGDHGVRRIDAVGKKMDPFLHEVMLKEDSDEEEDVVTEELLPGYVLRDKVIRHSKVKIAKNSKVN